MKKAEGKPNKPRKNFAFGRGFYAYIVLLIGSFIFTEALRSPVSIVLLWFMILLPFGLLLLTVAMKNGIAVFVSADQTTSEKNVAISYDFQIINGSILPISYLEAYIYVPSNDGVRCVEKRLLLSILPKGRYRFSDDIVFKYRGRYSVGVGDVYVSDPLRFFVMKRTLDVYHEMFILPRKKYLQRSTDNAASDLPSDSNTVVSGIESSESNRIREYRAGDSLKHIHWKLSSKVQDLQVNEYNPNTGKNVYVFCDFSLLESEERAGNTEEKRKKKKAKKKKTVKLKLERKAVSSMMSTDEVVDAANASAAERAEAVAALAKTRDELTEATKEEALAEAETLKEGETSEAPIFNAAEYWERANKILPEYQHDMDYFCADGVSEIAIGAVFHEIEEGNTVTLMWFDERMASGFSGYQISSYSDFDLIFTQFATAPFAKSEYKVTRLPDLIEDVENPTFLFATSKADLTNVSEFVDAGHRMGADAVEILFFNPKERYKDPALRAEYVENCRSRFAENNIILSECRIEN